ncbi:MAG TPA: SufE family protein [Candidatus Sulfomarinibacteraceae bacterium]|nr:SufE family protein [Candidatus Sulfomarinibacteraceae bacterium]
MEEKIPPRLQEIVEDFQILQGRERLEYLLQLADSLPPLPEWLHDERDNMDEVHECMTPVFIYADRTDNGLQYHFDVPQESPTVRGYAAILHEGTRGLSPEEVLAIPPEFYHEMGLQEVLSAQRLNGIGAILRHVKQLAQEKAA